MKETPVTFPELALIAGTRAAAGVGLGLLLSNRLSESARRAAGWSLFLVGALSTIPLAWDILGRRREPPGVEANTVKSPPPFEAKGRFDRPASVART